MGNSLCPFQQLTGSSPLISSNAKYKLVIIDGNLLLKKGSTILWQRPIPTISVPGAFAMITDGLVEVKNPSSVTLYSFGSSGHPGSCLIVQDDGNLVIQEPNGTIIWSSNTGQFALVHDNFDAAKAAFLEAQRGLERAEKALLRIAAPGFDRSGLPLLPAFETAIDSPPAAANGHHTHA